MPAVSVIVPTYNSSATLRCALETVRGQTFTDFEVLVIGDGCTDDSPAVVTQLADARFHWWNLSSNSGSKSAPINAALGHARGEFVAFLAHDDLWLPDHLSTLVGAPGADLAHSLCAVIDPQGRHEVWGGPPEGWTHARHCPTPSTWLLRHEFSRRLGTWRDPYRLGRESDAEYYQRAHRAGARIVSVPSLSVIRFASESWRLYDVETARPQPSHLARLQAEPHRYRQEILAEIAVAHSRYHFHLAIAPLPRALADATKAWRDLVRSLAYALMLVWGRERWPMPALLRARYRNKKRRNRLRRGLGAEPGAGK